MITNRRFMFSTVGMVNLGMSIVAGNLSFAQNFSVQNDLVPSISAKVLAQPHFFAGHSFSSAYQSSFATSSQTLLTYYLAYPQGCRGRVPDHPNIPVPRDNALRWSGRCVNGWMEGTGELDRFRDGNLVERDLSQMSQGIRTGSNVALDLDPQSFTYQVKTYSRWRNGFPYGEVLAYANNVLFYSWEADGRGGMVPTMNPLNGILRMLGQQGTSDERVLLLRLFTGSLQRSGADAATCYSLMRQQGFAEDVARRWCS